MQPRWSGQFMLTTLVFLLLAFGTALADWGRDPNTNTRVIEDSSGGSRFYSQSVTDEAGGMICLWIEGIGSSPQLVAQRVDHTGARMFGDNGVFLDTGGEIAQTYSLAPDGYGGFFVAWNRINSAGTLVFAQHYNAQGNSTWSSGGVSMQQFVVVGTVQSEPKVVSGGDGGAIVAWIDKTDGTQTVYETRFNSSGSRVWSVVTVANPEVEVRSLFVAPGEIPGESCLVWEQYFPGSGWNTQTQIVSPEGETVIPYYFQSLSSENGDQVLPQVVPFEDGGVFATWYDTNDGSVRFQWKDRSGNNHLGSSGGGILGGQYDDFDNLTLVKGDNQDAYILFTDSSNNDEGMDRVAASYFNGSNYLSWGITGMTVFEGVNSTPRSLAGLADGNGGLFVAWEDHDTFFLKATHLDVDGVVDWPGERREFSRRLITTAMEDGIVLVDDGAHGFVAGWLGFDFDANNFAPAVQKIGMNGFMGDNTFRMTTVTDMPNDQGGELIVTWDASPLDNSIIGAIENYSVWVMGQDKAVRREDTRSSSELAGILGMEESAVADLRSTGFVYSGSVPAVFAAEYSAFCPSFGDSTASGVPSTVIKVIAHHEEHSIFWDSSNQVSGYSVDNLAPGAPLSLAGLNNSGTAQLSWTASGHHDEDLALYRVYRGSESGFVLDETTLVGSSLTPGLVDNTASGTVFYRVTAVDAHGNEGLASDEVMLQLAVSAVDGMPTVFNHRGNYPNPFNPMTRIAFDLPGTSAVRVTVYDASGRLVNTLISETRASGHHEVRWNGQDSNGRAVSSGVYFSRVEAGEFSATRSMTLVR